MQAQKGTSWMSTNYTQKRVVYHPLSMVLSLSMPSALVSCLTSIQIGRPAEITWIMFKSSFLFELFMFSPLVFVEAVMKCAHKEWFLGGIFWTMLWFEFGAMSAFIHVHSFVFLFFFLALHILFHRFVFSQPFYFLNVTGIKFTISIKLINEVKFDFLISCCLFSVK